MAAGQRARPDAAQEPYVAFPASAVVSAFHKAIPTASRKHVHEVLAQADKFKERFEKEDLKLRKALEERGEKMSSVSAVSTFAARKLYDLDAVMWASLRLLETQDQMQRYAFVRLYWQLQRQHGQREIDVNLGVVYGEPPPPVLEEAVMAITGVRCGMAFYDLYARSFVYSSLTEDIMGRCDPEI